MREQEEPEAVIWEWNCEGETSKRKWFSVVVTLKGGQEGEQPDMERR